LALSCTLIRAKSKPFRPKLMDKSMINSAVFRPFATITLFVATTWGISAQGNIDSIYTDIDLNECLVIKADDFGASFACPGYKGFPLLISEGDLRFFVSYGFGAPDEMAARQTVPAFNTIGDTLEWRVTNKTGDFMPFATILRYHTDAGDGSTPKGEILVVTKIETGNTCHIAYVDARLTSNANEVARKLADETAETFDCAEDEPQYVPG
jgi:hypothetical protein